MALPNTANNSKLNELIFYAIDKASPYALAQHKSTNSLQEIAALRLSQLAITDQGKAIMWLWINAHSSEFGAKLVSPKDASKADTVEAVVTAVYKTVEA